MTPEAVRAALQGVVDADLERDLVDLDVVRDIQVSGDRVQVRLASPYPPAAARADLERRVRETLTALPGVGEVQVDVGFQALSTRPAMAPPLLEQVRNVVVVASGKGGVGKSTVATNLAAALAADGAAVGLLDADIYGPSVPALLGLKGEKLQTDGQKILARERYGMKVISMGLLVEEGESVIWRGPMLHSVLRQFLGDVDWGALDYLVIDLPPGTGDVQLSLCQTVPIGGAVVVSTPQDVALGVAVKAVNMFEKLNTPIVGVIENMSYYVCPHCGERDDVFGHGGARQATERLGLPFLGEIPLESRVRQHGDQGAPVVVAAPDSAAARALSEAARLLTRHLAVAAVHGYERLRGGAPSA